MIENSKLEEYVNSKKTELNKQDDFLTMEIAYIQHNIEAIKFINQSEGLNGNVDEILKKLHRIGDCKIRKSKEVTKVLRKNGIKPKFSFEDLFYEILSILLFASFICFTLTFGALWYQIVLDKHFMSYHYILTLFRYSFGLACGHAIYQYYKGKMKND